VLVIPAIGASTTGVAMANLPYCSAGFVAADVIVSLAF